MTHQDIFDTLVLERPEFAHAAAFLRGGADPVVMTAGPIVKRGTVPVANDAPWHIGSISKSFTATLVMRLVERAQLDLETPVGTYLPDYVDQMHADWSGITLRQLLSHTAGLPANAPLRLMRQTLEDDPFEGRRAVLSEMWGSATGGGTGQFLYSNLGYVLAGVIIEEITGRSWEDTILSELAVPFGLPSLGFGAPTDVGAAWGHQSILGYKRPIPPDNPASDNPKWLGPAGTIHLNLADLVTWGQLHLRARARQAPTFLTQASCAAMQSPVSAGYGLGWALQDVAGPQPVVWHNGSNTMWYAVLCFVPNADLTLAVATNTCTPTRMDQFVKEFMAALIIEEP